MTFLAELKRRNVIRMAGLYLVGAWLVVQVAGTLLPMFGAPDWMPRAVVILLAVGFLPVAVFSWVYEFTPEGLKRESEIDRSQSTTQTTGQRIEHALVVLLALGLAYFAFDKFVLSAREKAKQQQASLLQVEQARKEAGADALVKAYGDKSIAVLPFVNMSSDKEQEYFADGIAEELLNQLAKIHGLRVIARTSSFSFKGRNADVATIAKALDVAHLLEGSVRRSGNRLRISAKLIRTADSGELWSETYDREMADVFGVQDEIAASVAAQLKIKLLGAAPTSTVVDPQAYALYLQARQLRYLRTAAAYIKAIDLLRQALKIEPDFAEAWTLLSRVYRNQADGGLIGNVEGYRLARQAANKAVTLDPELADPHAELAQLSQYNDLPAAAAHVSRALSLAPDNVDVLRAASAVVNSLGRRQEAIGLAEAVLVRDPNNPSSHSLVGNSYWQAGRAADSIPHFREMLRLSPGFIGGHDSLSNALVDTGQLEAGLAESLLEPDGPWRLASLAKAYFALGRRAESDSAIAELKRRFAKDTAYNIAYIYAYRGEADATFEWLEKAVQYQDPGLADIVANPSFDRLHKDPRWQALLRRIGKAPEQLAAIRLDVQRP